MTKHGTHVKVNYPNTFIVRVPTVKHAKPVNRGYSM